MVFKARGKPEYSEKNLSQQGREPTLNSARICLGATFELKATLVGGEYFEKLKYFKIYFNHTYLCVREVVIRKAWVWREVMLTILDPVNRAMTTTTFRLNINNTCLIIQYMLVIKLYYTFKTFLFFWLAQSPS